MTNENTTLPVAPVSPATEIVPANRKAKRVAKSPKAAKAAKSVAAKKVAKPAKPANDTARAERQALIDEARTFVASFYNGASLTVHKHKAASRDVYASRVSHPVQKCAGGNLTSRDESLLALCLSEANSKTFAFDPVALACDAGGLSRLASVDMLTFKDDTFTVSPTGAARAKALLKRSKVASAAATA